MEKLFSKTQTETGWKEVIAVNKLDRHTINLPYYRLWAGGKVSTVSQNDIIRRHQQTITSLTCAHPLINACVGHCVRPFRKIRVIIVKAQSINVCISVCVYVTLGVNSGASHPPGDVLAVAQQLKCVGYEPLVLYEGKSLSTTLLNAGSTSEQIFRLTIVLWKETNPNGVQKLKTFIGMISSWKPHTKTRDGGKLLINE